MVRLKQLRFAVLAATSLLALTSHTPPPPEPDRAPFEFVSAPLPAVAETREIDSASNRWLAAGAIAAAITGLLSLLNWSKMSKALAKVGQAVISAPAAAVRIAVDLVGKPVRALLIVGGLLMVALAGVGFFDIEWIAGLFIGAALAIAAFVAFLRTKRALNRR